MVEMVAIVTLEGYTNFGNLLQNFALQETLKELGALRVVTLRGLPRAESRSLGLRRRLGALAEDPAGFVLNFLTRGSRGPDLVRVDPARMAAIRQFAQEHITDAPAADPADRLAFASQSDRVIVGSDQVWNPAFTHGNAEWFLSFVPPERRIAYAASFGIPQVPGYLVPRYRSGLRGIHHLSVREHRAAKIVRDLTGRTPPVLLDPTMLLEETFWAGVATTPPELAGREYLLDFSLKSGDSRSEGMTAPGAGRASVLKYAREEGLEVVDLFSPASPGLVHITPFDFIGAIREARLVVTDSFHAAVFSTLFHVPFVLEQRGAMNSRLESLLFETGLQGRMLGEWADQVQPTLQIDWAHVDARLALRRQESLSFLRGALVGVA